MKENTPLVSVLMVTYNRGKVLKETINSVLGQTYKNIQFIIVDDGSTDDSYDIIKSFHDPRIEVYQLKKNRHICYATNYGFSKVKGDYLARIDSDDVWYLDKLEKQLDFLKNNDKYKICFSWIDLIDENGKSINEKNKELLHLFESDFTGQSDCLRYFFMHGNCLSHPSVLMETVVMKSIGGFHPGYMQSHDFEYWIRIAKKYPIYVMQERLLAMRRFDDDKEMDNNSSASYVNSLRFYNEYIDVKRHFFDEMDDDLFVKTFKEDFINKDALSEAELECEKAFLFCRPVLQSTKIPSIAVEKFYELLLNDETKRVLEENYDFTEKTFYKMTGETIYFDYFVEEKLNTLDVQVSELERENNFLKEQVHLYKNSMSWKITKPLRDLSRKVKKVMK